MHKLKVIKNFENMLCKIIPFQSVFLGKINSNLSFNDTPYPIYFGQNLDVIVNQSEILNIVKIQKDYCD